MTDINTLLADVRTLFSDDEVVTNAYVRYLTLPDLDGEIALITLDNGLDHTRPSTFGPGGLAALNSAMDEIEAHTPGVKAIAVGHPLASSGVRLMTQLARHFAEHPEVRYGLTAMCIGIGMGGTVIWENPNWEGTK